MVFEISQKNERILGVVAHIFDPSTQEFDASLINFCCRETLCKRKQTNKQKQEEKTFLLEEY